jgi:hypothetical protein
MKFVSVLMITMIVLDPLSTQAYERKIKGDGKIVKTKSPKKLKTTKSPKGGSKLKDRKLKKRRCEDCKDEIPKEA